MTTTTTAAPSIDINAFRAPNSTYCRASDVAPEIKDGKILCSNGTGYSASWGSTYSKSTVVHRSDDLIIINVRWGCKHAWGDQDYYFVPTRGGWKRTTKTGARKQLAAAGLL